MPPWWIIVLLSMLGVTSQKRHAEPYLTPAEHDVLNLFYQLQRRGAQLQQIRELDGRIRALKADLDTRIARGQAQSKKLIARVAALDRRYPVPPDIMIELRAAETERKETEALAERFNAYVNSYVMLVERSKKLEGSELCGYV